MGFWNVAGKALIGAAVGFVVGGPVGAGIGAVGGAAWGIAKDAKSIQGNKHAGRNGALVGAGIGFMAGGPVGALAGAGIGWLGGKLLGGIFKPKKQPPRQAPYYPQMNMGMPGMGMGMGMPGMGMGMGMQMGMMPPFMGMQMGGMGMQGMMGMGGNSMMMMMMYGGNGMMMAGGTQQPMGMQGMMGWGMQQPVRGGQLQQKAPGKPITYTTSGGYKVNVKGHTITVTDPTGKNTVKHWGDPHEDVNGKRIKDWEGKTRSLVLGDGTKLTMNADGPHGVVRNMNIYDGNQAISINNDKTQVTNVSFNPYQSAMQEMYQPDGETAYVGYNRAGEFTYTNMYTQDKNLGVRQNYKVLAGSKNNFWGGNNHFPPYYSRLPWA